MRVTDEQVAALGALLGHDLPTYEKLAPAVGGIGYDALFACAFVEAVRRRFGGLTHGDIVQYVADVRIRMIDTTYSIDPLAAELLLRAAASGETGLIASLDDDTKRHTEAALLDELVSDEQFDAVGLNDFLVQARTRAERMAD